MKNKEFRKVNHSL